MESWKKLLLCVGSTTMLAGAASAQSAIYETPGPFGGPFGLIGYDVSAQQSVAVRFTPDADYWFDSASVWIMSNDFGSVPSGAHVRVTLRTDLNDGQTSVPSEIILEELGFKVSAIGWAPVLESVSSSVQPMVRSGRNYWLVLESDVPNNNPVWNWATGATGFVANTTGGQNPWQPGGSGAVVGTVIDGSPACYADCDMSGGSNILDFICFGDAFAMQEPYADCDGSGAFNILDYICFGDAFGAGCP